MAEVSLTRPRHGRGSEGRRDSREVTGEGVGLRSSKARHPLTTGWQVSNTSLSRMLHSFLAKGSRRGFRTQVSRGQECLGTEGAKAAQLTS